jgi:hypothetical protein
MQEATTRAAEGSAQRPPAPALCSVCSVIKDPAKHMGGKEVVVGPASIVMCDQAERMDIAAGNVPCVHLRGSERAALACACGHAFAVAAEAGRAQGTPRASPRVSWAARARPGAPTDGAQRGGAIVPPVRRRNAETHV